MTKWFTDSFLINFTQKNIFYSNTLWAALQQCSFWNHLFCARSEPVVLLRLWVWNTLYGPKYVDSVRVYVWTGAALTRDFIWAFSFLSSAGLVQDCSDPGSELQSWLSPRGDGRHTYPSALIPGQPELPSQGHWGTFSQWPLTSGSQQSVPQHQLSLSSWREIREAGGGQTQICNMSRISVFCPFSFN